MPRACCVRGQRTPLVGAAHPPDGLVRVNVFVKWPTNFREFRKAEVRRIPKFSGSSAVASRNRLLRFLAPCVATWSGYGVRSSSCTQKGDSFEGGEPEIATANFREFLVGNSRACMETGLVARQRRGGPFPGAKIGPRRRSGAGDGTSPTCACHRSRLGPDRPSRGCVFPGGTEAQRFRAHGERSGPGNWRVSPRRPLRAARRRFGEGPTRGSGSRDFSPRRGPSVSPPALRPQARSTGASRRRRRRP